MAKGNMKGKNVGDSNRGTVANPTAKLPNSRLGSLLSNQKSRNSGLNQSRKNHRTKHGSYVRNR